MLEKQLSLTGPDSTEKEDYILTEQEEKSAIDNAIVQVKSFLEWKLLDLGYSKMETMKRIYEFNYLEKINEDEVLDRANSMKHQDVWHKEQRERERLQETRGQEEKKQYWNAKRMYHYMRWTSENIYDKKFILHENNRELVTAVCYFLTSDQRFESEMNYSLKKGLLIRGVAGLGKTYVVRCASQNLLNPVRIESMLEITERIQRDGVYELPLGDYKKIYIDDVGTEEPVVKYFGTNIYFFKNFIERYYLSNKPFNNLIISTNNSFDELEHKYGFRVRSRTKEMFNIIDVAGEDMRGK